MSNKERIFNEQFLSIPMMAHQLLLEVIQGWIWMGLAGGIIVGDSRMGKTTAIMAILNKLLTRDKLAIPSFIVTMSKRDKDTIRAVFFCIFTELGLVASNKHRTADELSAQIRLYLREYCQSSGSNRVVLFVDETQRLTPKQMQAFAELYDKMALDNIQMTVIFIANQQECQKLLSAILNQDGHAHIRGRFFREAHQFNGISSLKEVKHCLRHYDNVKYQPDNASFTETFLPEAYDNDFRLESLSQALWQCFQNGIKKELKLNSWPSQYFFSTVNILLTHLLPRFGVDNEVDEQILEAIRASGIKPSLKSVVLSS